MNQLDMKGRVAVVTGGAQGIGYAVAERMLNSGATVALWDIDGVQLEKAAKALGQLGTVSLDTVELTDEASVQAATQATIARHGRLDARVNSAGITGGNGTTWELAPDVWRRVIVAKAGVLVNAVTPAAAKTPIFDSMNPEHIEFMLSKIPMGRFLEVDEAASMITWLATEDCAFSTAAVFDLSGGRATY
jgi:3-oxoacyl-[acyl-carrier protein] reductase